jgi:hypothetical protein
MRFQHLLGIAAQAVQSYHEGRLFLLVVLLRHEQGILHVLAGFLEVVGTLLDLAGRQRRRILLRLTVSGRADQAGK